MSCCKMHVLFSCAVQNINARKHFYNERILFLVIVIQREISSSCVAKISTKETKQVKNKLAMLTSLNEMKRLATVRNKTNRITKPHREEK